MPAVLLLFRRSQVYSLARRPMGYFRRDLRFPGT